MPMNSICSRFGLTSRNHTSNTVIKIFRFFSGGLVHITAITVISCKKQVLPYGPLMSFVMIWLLFGP